MGVTSAPVVVKVGSSTLVTEDGSLDSEYIANLSRQAADLMDMGTQVIIVSSGAAAVGRERLGIDKRPSDIPTLQACAAAGQASLTKAYEDALRARGHACAQVLLTRRDVVDREGYLNARNTFSRLLELGAIPVVNENDTVSVAEFAFGDNDMLGAIVSALVGARLYVVLSDVDGLYTANPSVDASAELLSDVCEIDNTITGMAGESVSSVGTGGMGSKIRAARAMLAAGIPMVICHGRLEHVLTRVVGGERLGTRFEAKGVTHGTPRKLWIGLAEVAQGSLHLDEGATKAVIERGASVLPVGVVRVDGSFSAGDVVDVISPEGLVIGRGVARYSSDELSRFRGLKLEVIGRFVESARVQPAIHRDELLVF